MQTAAVRSNASKLALIAGIGSSKTTAGAMRAGRFIGELKSSTGLVIAPTYPMLRDATLVAYLEMLYPLISEKNLNKSDMEIRVPDATLPERDRSKILFRSGDRPDRIRGPNVSWCHLDEADYLRRYLYRVAIGRLREKGRKPLLWATSSPSIGGWLYAEFEVPDGKWLSRNRFVGKGGDVEILRYATWENPFLSDEYLIQLLESYPEETRRLELEGMRVEFGGSALPIDRAIHVRPHEEMPDPASLRSWGGAIDDGFVHPRAAYRCGVSGSDQLFVYPWGEFEYFRKRELPHEFWDNTWAEANGPARRGDPREKWGGRRPLEEVFVDPSAVELIEEGERRDVPVMRAVNERILGWRLLRNRFEVRHGKPGIVISDRCPMLIAQLGGLHHKSRKVPSTGETIFEEDVEKVDDDGPDAVRYWVASTQGSSGGVAVATRRRRR